MADLYQTPPKLAVSELRTHPEEVFTQLKKTHLMLTHKG